MGWFYGFKLHLIINHKGEILATKLTAGNVDDRKPVPEMAKDLYGKLYTQIEHSRHRSVSGFMLNLIGSLIAYCHKKDKPTIRIDESDMKTLCI